MKKEKKETVYIRCECSSCGYQATKYRLWIYCPNCGKEIVEEAVGVLPNERLKD